MIVSVHQPHFLPWAGYFNKVLRSDVFVWLHNVQYRKNYYQNRTRIKANDQPLWLTLPVRAHLGMAIDEVSLAEPQWRKRVCRTIEQNYRKAPHFDDCWPAIAGALEASAELLEDVNYRTFSAVLKLLNADSVKIVRAGDLNGTSEDPTDRLVELCRTVGGTAYIAGRGGHNYLRVPAFEQSGLRVIWQEFNPLSIQYPQAGTSFLPGLSTVDCLFNLGPEKAREVVLGAWTP